MARHLHNTGAKKIEYLVCNSDSEEHLPQMTKILMYMIYQITVMSGSTNQVWCNKTADRATVHCFRS
jgi:hypothetical protein